MAEDIRSTDSNLSLMEERSAEIRKEACRQQESCLYTSTSMYIWLRRVRTQNQIFIAAPILICGFAGLSVFQGWVSDWFIAVLTLIAGLFPALADALKFQTSVNEISKTGAEFKALQDRFRRLANISILGDVDEAEEILSELMDRMDSIRSNSLTPPEWAFDEAQHKIASGDYQFGVDDG